MIIDAIPTTSSKQDLQRFLEKLTDTLKKFPQPSKGTFTPTVTFATPGDLAVVYTTQVGSYWRMGARVHVSCYLAFTPTFTTAAGDFSVVTLPYTSKSTGYFRSYGSASDMGVYWVWGSGITSVTPCVYPDTTAVKLIGTGTATALSVFSVSNLTSAQAHTLGFSITYEM